ncbi:hypothetical protein L3Y34_010586 [Caenorhabditis briggsae]|uniref:Uncharacterized protein n=1 Tax=Caenorhabditis briggsae TaxID=6238 RepID=A0AAE8ZMX2_CAEBR|nr:hypothetical protein L3Y34_010586 [Caenorhabditis briggsae]
MTNRSHGSAKSKRHLLNGDWKVSFLIILIISFLKKFKYFVFGLMCLPAAWNFRIGPKRGVSYTSSRSRSRSFEGMSSTEEYRQRLQEAKDHRAHTLVAGDKKLPFIECLYDAGGGAIPQNVNQPLKAHQLYMDFEMFDDNAPTRARIEPTTYAEVTSKWTSSIRFVPKMSPSEWRLESFFFDYSDY